MGTRYAYGTDIHAGRAFMHRKQNLKKEGRKGRQVGGQAGRQTGRWLSRQAGRTGRQGSEAQRGEETDLAAY